MSIENDLRIIKTRKLIRDAFVKLIDIKGFDAITINNIADMAMINRSTFYLHYTDKYDLLQKTMEEAIQNILQLVAPEAHIIDNQLEYDSFVQNISSILKTVENDALLYKIILNDKEMSGISKKFENALIEKLDICFPDHILISRDLFLQLITSLYMSAIRWWLNNDMKYSTNFIAEQLVKLLVAGPCKTVRI
ncbi:transcriptional regulator, TetR family [Anaerocolumna jejuensis DSM 15929]|uniref:Transcriptional regulator, TetR family n=1 Tax=Anaerocolumna jejuensis DSM 15929 TaxID=1121322 RepID=A0A1M7BPU8_9FIRM|nr:TetR/AcrR family transcriptional regulator [Anaerocolumna jejuensis]SHL57052.1 transcriptional regulator, TetR family [Anaerocolumna jejuensis DSM 15929]